MAKITNSAREDFSDKVKPYKDEIDKILAKEKNILSTMDRDSDNAAYKRILRIVPGLRPDCLGSHCN